MSLEIPEKVRYEIKFVAYEREIHRLLQWVKLHPAGFISPYPDRRINNIYFDTQDCQAYAENLSGASGRRKVRYRWYGNRMQIGKGVLEVKCKRNYFGWKQQHKINVQPDKGGSSWREIRNTMLAELSNDGKRILHNNPNPVLINQYDRKYFVTNDGIIRLTVDRNQNVWDQRYKPKPNYNYRANLCKTIVIEIKFNRGEQAYASQIIQGIPLRVSRNSKYMVGVHTISLISHAW
jgi:SPX domain protein involved in polyphosphate accumulation